MPKHLQVPPEQVKPVPSREQSRQLLPQTYLVLSTQDPPPQRLYPAAQEMPQEPPEQYAVPFGSPGQGVQLLPQLLVPVSETQLPPQVWKPLTQPAK